jgi:hypothetical protein
LTTLWSFSTLPFHKKTGCLYFLFTQTHRWFREEKIELPVNKAQRPDSIGVETAYGQLYTGPYWVQPFVPYLENYSGSSSSIAILKYQLLTKEPFKLNNGQPP